MPLFNVFFSLFLAVILSTYIIISADYVLSNRPCFTIFTWQTRFKALNDFTLACLFSLLTTYLFNLCFISVLESSPLSQWHLFQFILLFPIIFLSKLFQANLMTFPTPCWSQKLKWWHGISFKTNDEKAFYIVSLEKQVLSFSLTWL